MKYEEYPKYIEPENGKPFIVQTKEEHDAYLKSLQEAAPKPRGRPRKVKEDGNQ